MKNVFILAVLVLMSLQMQSQVSSSYEISFENAVHHEAEIQVTFKNLKKELFYDRFPFGIFLISVGA